MELGLCHSNCMDNEYTKQLEDHTNNEIKRYEDLKQDIKELKEQVATLIDIWNQAKGVITFIKWVTSIVGGLTAFILFIKEYIK